MHTNNLWEVYLTSKDKHGLIINTVAYSVEEAKENAIKRVQEKDWDHYGYVIERVTKL